MSRCIHNRHLYHSSSTTTTSRNGKIWSTRPFNFTAFFTTSALAWRTWYPTQSHRWWPSPYFFSAIHSPVIDRLVEIGWKLVFVDQNLKDLYSLVIKTIWQLSAIDVVDSLEDFNDRTRSGHYWILSELQKRLKALCLDTVRAGGGLEMKSRAVKAARNAVNH